LLMTFAILPLQFKNIHVSTMGFCLFWMLSDNHIEGSSSERYS
jgi:hypothetical protein